MTDLFYSEILTDAFIPGSTLSDGFLIEIFTGTFCVTFVQFPLEFVEGSISKVELTFDGTVEEIGYATNSTFDMLPSTNSSGNYTKVTQKVPVKISIKNPSDKVHLIRWVFD